MKFFKNKKLRNSESVNNTEAENEQFIGERGIPSLNTKGRFPKKKLLFFCFIILVVGIGFAFLTSSKNDNKKHNENKLTEKNTKTFSFSDSDSKIEPSSKLNTTQSFVTNNHNDNDNDNYDQLEKVEEEVKPVLNKSSSSLMVINSNVTNVENENNKITNQETIGQSDDRMLTATYTPSVRAQKIADRNMLIAKGAFINCSLQTRLDTTVQGMLSCRVTENVYSDNGNFVLIERGSTVTGEYRSEVENGKNRIFVLWNRIKTPRGIVINIDSMATDSLGGAGIDGYVDNHFWKRFGNAILMSLVDDVNQIVINRTSKDNNSTLTLDNTADSANELITEILKNSINIAPTLYRNHGDMVGIFVTRDLDFSSVYRAKIKY